jgi:hypothetical protein
MQTTKTQGPGPGRPRGIKDKQPCLRGYLGEAETAQALGVSVQTLRRMRRRGQGPRAIQINRHHMYGELALGEYLEDLESKAKTLAAERRGEIPPRRGRPRTYSAGEPLPPQALAAKSSS